MEKPMIKNIAKLSIRVALVAAVAFPLIIAMSARAQEPAPPPPTGTNVTPAGAPAATEATAERVMVTGSNTTENNTNGGDGSTRISLRGIDPKETLVLQDGRRLVNGGSGPGGAQ